VHGEAVAFSSDAVGRVELFGIAASSVLGEFLGESNGAFTRTNASDWPPVRGSFNCETAPVLSKTGIV
jgi:hypothetical protein